MDTEPHKEAYTDDIHPPESEEIAREEFLEGPREKGFFGASGKRAKRGGKGSLRGMFLKTLAISFAVVASVGVIVLAAASYALPRAASQSIAHGISDFQGGVRDLKDLNASSAEEKFQSAQDGLDVNMNNILLRLGTIFSSGKEAAGNFKDLTENAVALAGELGYFESNAPSLLFGGTGGELITHLERVHGILMSINQESAALSSTLGKASSRLPAAAGFYLPFKLDLARMDDFLGALIPWLKDPAPHHIALFFQNPSELRPAGGFLGSYADVTVAGGSIASVEMHDINDVDRGFSEHIIPPQPLELLETRWHIADANWFFDFPTSAEKVLGFMSSSSFYEAGNATGTIHSGAPFDGAIAVSPKVISDLLAITGPIELPDEKITVDKDNFLESIQAEVQQGQASKSSYPKKILSDLAPILIAKLQALTDGEKQSLLQFAAQWARGKDLMLYFSDPKFESFFRAYGMAGDVASLPADFEGDYFALADANVGGGKSDLYMKEAVTFQSQINEDGTVSDHVVLDRAHTGNAAKYWWYKTTNQTYVQIFANGPVTFVNESGGVAKKIPPTVNYAKAGYAADPDVAALASTTRSFLGYPEVALHEESGKDVLTTWSTVKAGAKSEITFDYTHRLYAVPTDGTKYEFIFEKQPGTDRTYDFEISAPVGYKFAENNLPVYEWKGSDVPVASATSTAQAGPPGRLVVDLTLAPIGQ